MVHIILIYLIIIIYHAFLVVPFKEYTPNQLVKAGYITWTNNFKYQNETIDTLIYSSNLTTQKKYRYRIDLILGAYFRWMCNNPLKFDQELKKLRDKITDTNSISPEKFFEAKKRSKISL